MNRRHRGRDAEPLDEQAAPGQQADAEQRVVDGRHERDRAERPR